MSIVLFSNPLARFELRMWATDKSVSIDAIKSPRSGDRPFKR